MPQRKAAAEGMAVAPENEPDRVAPVESMFVASAAKMVAAGSSPSAPPPDWGQFL
ncbi:MAG: hypothetical protein SOZ00_05060 [Tidjanibacter sp.]|nr:hypothetical protein [Tidjanibacter sp.]